MAKQTFTAGQVLTAAELNTLQANDYNWTVSTKTDDYTLVAADKGTRIVANKATAIAFTVDDSIFAAGDTLAVQNINTGTLTLTAGSGVSINGADVLTVAQWQGGTLYFTSASSAIWFPSAKTVSAGVVQVKSAAKTDTYSSTSTSFVDVTDLEVTITPTSASNKVLIIAQVTVGLSNNTNVGHFRLAGGNSGNYVGNASASTVQAVFAGATDTNLSRMVASMGIVYLDSPATTSATTYKVQQRTAGFGTTFVNRSHFDPGTEVVTRGASSITVLEVTP